MANVTVLNNGDDFKVWTDGDKAEKVCCIMASVLAVAEEENLPPAKILFWLGKGIEQYEEIHREDC